MLSAAHCSPPSPKIKAAQTPSLRDDDERRAASICCMVLSTTHARSIDIRQGHVTSDPCIILEAKEMEGGKSSNPNAGVAADNVVERGSWVGTEMKRCYSVDPSGGLRGQRGRARGCGSGV